MESRIIDEMTSFFLNADNSNVIDKKRPKNITFRNQHINQSTNTNNTSQKQTPNKTEINTNEIEYQEPSNEEESEEMR